MSSISEIDYIANSEFQPDESVQKHINSLIESLKGLLSRFADKNGVSVEFNRSKRHMIRFVFDTPEGFAIKVPFDLNQTSKDYINSMMTRLGERLDDAKKQRHTSPIIVSGSF